MEYDGTTFAGFQWQANLPSIQGALESAVSKATGESPRITAAGRTDAGAHAFGQVIAFTLDSRLDDATLLNAMNAYLPEQVALRSLETVDADFDPRRWARTREYNYLVLNCPTRSPLWHERAHHVRTPLDLDAMRQASVHFFGVHDFSAFATPSDGGDSAVREIFSIEISRDGDLIAFRIVGNAFLQHMIRTLVGALVQVGEGKYSPDHVDTILKSQDRRNAPPPVPACGLYLMNVTYGKEKHRP